MLFYENNLRKSIEYENLEDLEKSEEKLNYTNLVFIHTQKAGGSYFEKKLVTDIGKIYFIQGASKSTTFLLKHFGKRCISFTIFSKRFSKIFSNFCFLNIFLS